MSKKCRVCIENDATETAQFQTVLNQDADGFGVGDIYNQTDKFQICGKCSSELLDHIIDLIKSK